MFKIIQIIALALITVQGAKLRNKAVQSFTEYDTDNNGEVSKEEYKDMIKKYAVDQGMKVSDIKSSDWDEIMKGFHAADTNGDGVISTEEAG